MDETLMSKLIYLLMQQKLIKKCDVRMLMSAASTHVEVSGFALKSNFASLTTEVDKLDIDKLVKLSNIVKNDVVKKTVYDKLLAKVDKIDTTGFVLKTTYDTDKSDLGKKISDADKKISDTSELAKIDLNAKSYEIEGKISSITGLATNSALTAVENKIPNVSSQKKKKKKTTDYDTKISQTEKKFSDHNHDKYITTPEFNNLGAGVFTARLARAK